MRDKGKGVPVAELIEVSKRYGLDDNQIDRAVKALISQGKCYEPKIGLLAKSKKKTNQNLNRT